MTVSVSPPVATEIRIRALVQGVGFRPTVWRLATRLGLAGDVRNDAEGVLVRIAAETHLAERLVADLRAECPPLARIDSVEYKRAEPLAMASGFQITDSETGEMRTEVAPDLPGLPRRNPRSFRQAVPLPLHQLHPLRAAPLHHLRGAL